MIIDTHRFVENLVAGGYKKQHAEIFAKALNENQQELVTQTDLKLLKSELREDLSDVRSELKEDISNLKYDMLKWMFGFFISTVVINLTAITFAVRFLIK